MNPFETRKLGNSGVELTQLGFGSAPLGELFVRVDEATAAATLQAAWDAGIRYYDTAPYYGRGLAEIRCGRFLDTKPRSEFVLSSKVGRWFFPPAKPDAFQTEPWAGGLHFDHVHDYSYDGIMRSYEQSQMRLGMNRIDLLLIHDLDFWFHATEAKVSAYLSQLFSLGLASARPAALARAGARRGRRDQRTRNDAPLPRCAPAGFLSGGAPVHADGAGCSEGGVSLLSAPRGRRRGWAACSTQGSPQPVRRPARSTTTGTRRRKRSTVSPKSRPCARPTACRWRRQPSSSRSPIRSSPRSFPAPSARTRCGRTSSIAGSRSPHPSGRT